MDQVGPEEHGLAGLQTHVVHEVDDEAADVTGVLRSDSNDNLSIQFVLDFHNYLGVQAETQANRKAANLYVISLLNLVPVPTAGETARPEDPWQPWRKPSPFDSRGDPAGLPSRCS